jgi:hypothetical protein
VRAVVGAVLIIAGIALHRVLLDIIGGAILVVSGAQLFSGSRGRKGLRR